MPRFENTNIFSEINTFFTEKDDSKAIRTIMNVVQHLKLSEKSLTLESHWNCKYTRLQVFELLLLFPFFMVKNAFHYTDSSLAKVIPCKKDVFYRFMENGSINWRRMFYRINSQLISKILLRSDSIKSKDPVCLIIERHRSAKDWGEDRENGSYLFPCHPFLLAWIQGTFSLPYRW